MKQTAVEWLIEKRATGDLYFSDFLKAKEMEEEQKDKFVIDFHNWCKSEDTENLLHDLIMVGEVDKNVTTQQILEIFKTNKIMTTVEWLEEELNNIKSSSTKNGEIKFLENEFKGLLKQAKEIEEENLLKMLHKFAFDYTYNYKGEKTIYEWIPEWFEEYKRLEQLNK